MKRKILPAVLAFISLYSCQEEIMTPKPIPSDPAVPLEISMSTAELTKGLIKDTRLPDGSSVGITIKDDYGVYTGELFNNVKYTAEQESGNQVWSSDSPVMLSSETGTAYAYYPYADACTDIRAISIRANSTVQTDFMWGIPVSVSKDNRKATLVMKHALAAVRITYVRGTYSGTGNVSKVSFGGNCIAVAGTLDATDGSISNLAGKGTMLTPPQITTTLSSTLQEFELIVIPTGEKQGKIVITIDGKDYTLEFGDIDLRQGQITQFHLTVNDGELSLSDITVSEWTYADSKDTAIKVTDKVTLTGNLDDIAVYNSVVNGVVTITAVPKTKGTFKEVEPVSINSNATLSQSCDIHTGVRTITLTNITGNVNVTFYGTYSYDLIAEFTVNARESVRMLYLYFNSSDKEKILRIREGDEDIPVTSTHSWDEGGKHILRYSFTNHTVPYDMFNDVKAITAIEIGDCVTALESYAFKGTSIERIIIPETITSFGSSLFYNCTKLKNAVLPKGITEIYDSMFRGCTSLQSIDIPDGVTRFGDYAFDRCSSLASIILPAGVTYVGNYCFSECSNLRHIVSLPIKTPTLGGTFRYNFTKVASNGVLAVPAAAKTGSNYSYWVASNVNLGSYGWTLEYMDE
jgi:hypothetical protein